MGGLTIVIKFGGVETTKWNLDMLNENTSRLTLAKFSPTLGIISCSPAIIFSYDNFYSPTGLQSDISFSNRIGYCFNYQYRGLTFFIIK